MPPSIGSPESTGPSPVYRPPREPRASVVYAFEDCRLDPANRVFSRDGKEVALPGRAFDVLRMLVSHPGALLTKEELLDAVWGDSFVEESSLTVAVSTLRRALNEGPQERRFIQTMARRGYRFIAEVRESQESGLRTMQTSREVTEPQALEPISTPSSADVTDAALPQPARDSRAQVWFFPAIAAVLVLALLGGAWLFLRPGQPIHTLAVLPFTMSAVSAAQSAADASNDEVVLLGITDGLISRLGGELVVRPTSSVLRYSSYPDVGTAVDPAVVGREQSVDAVLSGSMQRSQGFTALNLRLLRVRDGRTLWQDTFKGRPDALASLQQKAGDAAAYELHQLGAVTAPRSAAANVPPHANDQAYQLFLRGRYFWNRRTVEGLRKSVDYFHQSIAADPNYAPAYAGLADSYALLASFSVEPGSSANADARSAALSAIQLDPTLAEPHASLGMIYFFTDWNLAAAEREFERSIQLNPNYATAHHWYALDLAAMGRFPQALYEIHIAQKLDPLSLIIGTNVGWIEYLARDYASANRDLQRVLELDPSFARAHARLGMLLLANGREQDAVAEFNKALQLSGDEDPWIEGLLGDALARTGNRAAAIRVLTELRQRSQSQYVPPISQALVLIGLGRKSEAIAALAQAEDDHSTSMVYARVDPALDAVRQEPEFRALLVRLKP